jgi:hypothetical protein
MSWDDCRETLGCRILLKKCSLKFKGSLTIDKKWIFKKSHGKKTNKQTKSHGYSVLIRILWEKALSVITVHVAKMTTS